jgi:hypothetical protein
MCIVVLLVACNGAGLQSSSTSPMGSTGVPDEGVINDESIQIASAW